MTPDTQTLEIILFRARAGVPDSSILTGAEALERQLVSLAGYRGRQLFRAEGQQWIEIVHWASLRDAQASHAIDDSPCAEAFDALVDAESIQVLYASPLGSFGPASGGQIGGS